MLCCGLGLAVLVLVVIVYLHDNSNIQMPIQKKIMQTRSSKKLETYKQKLETYKQRTLITV